MIIKRVEESDFEKYFSFDIVSKSVYNDIEWQKCFFNVENYAILDKDNKIIGGFILKKEMKFGFSFYKTIPYTPNICLFIEDKTQNFSSKLSFEKNLMEVLSSFFDKLPKLVIKIAFPPEFKDLQPFIWKKFKVVPNYTYRIDLTFSEEQLISRMSPKRRNDLKKAIKDGIEVKLVENNEEVLSIIKKTYARKDLNLSHDDLRKILFNFSNSGNSFAFVAYNNGIPVATTFCIHDKRNAYYILGGYDEKNRHQSAGAYCVWESILHAKKIGLSIFDFEGSMIPLVERYFRDFGGDLSPFFTVSKAKLSMEIILKFFKREYF